MARLGNGFLRGRIGELIYKEINGKQFVFSAYQEKKSERSVKVQEGNQLFGVTSSFAGAVLRVKVFAENWKNSGAKRKNPVSKIVKGNLPLLRITGDIASFRLVNDKILYPVSIAEYIFTPGEISANVIISSGPGLSPLISMQGVICLADPSEAGLKKNAFLPFAGGSCSYNRDEPVQIKVSILSASTELIKSYREVKVLFNLAFKTIEGEVRGFSEKCVK